LYNFCGTVHCKLFVYLWPVSHPIIFKTQLQIHGMYVWYTITEKPQLTTSALKKGFQMVNESIISVPLTISQIHAWNLRMRGELSWHHTSWCTGLAERKAIKDHPYFQVFCLTIQCILCLSNTSAFSASNTGVILNDVVFINQFMYKVAYHMPLIPITELVM
jgi:hypothetical protein